MNVILPGLIYVLNVFKMRYSINCAYNSYQPQAQCAPVCPPQVEFYKGEPGPKGSTGPTGASGSGTGTGATGPTGPIGLEGPEGPAGSATNTGATGPTGSQGLQGPTGFTGPIGSLNNYNFEEISTNQTLASQDYVLLTNTAMTVTLPLITEKKIYTILDATGFAGNVGNEHTIVSTAPNLINDQADIVINLDYMSITMMNTFGTTDNWYIV
jgi:hypothetical protein